ncbi:MAG: hypothetical protein JWR69_165 [Pedosphaera sp.]|nr:hypothetical protein [Pedosphaera sp.]
MTGRITPARNPDARAPPKFDGQRNRPALALNLAEDFTVSIIQSRNWRECGRLRELCRVSQRNSQIQGRGDQLMTAFGACSVIVSSLLKITFPSRKFWSVIQRSQQ